MALIRRWARQRWGRDLILTNWPCTGGAHSVLFFQPCLLQPPAVPRHVPQQTRIEALELLHLLRGVHGRRRGQPAALGGLELRLQSRRLLLGAPCLGSGGMGRAWERIVSTGKKAVT